MDEYREIVERLKNERREYMKKWEGLNPEIAGGRIEPES
jgi:hypothetical protein